MNTIKVAAVQMNALKDDLDHNLDVHVDFTRKAADAGCSLVLFPELSVSSHYGDPEAVKFAEEAESGRTFSLMSDLAKKYLPISMYFAFTRVKWQFVTSLLHSNLVLKASIR